MTTTSSSSTDSKQGGILVGTIEDVGPALAFLRNLAGISQRAVAARSGVNHTMVGDWELGARRPSAKNFLAMVDGLGYEVVLRPRSQD